MKAPVELRVTTDSQSVHVNARLSHRAFRILITPVSVISSVLVMLPLLLLGEWDWWRAWVALGVFVLASLVVLTPIISVDIVVVRLTALVRRDDPRADLLLLAVAGPLVAGWYVLIPADVFHLHLLARPPLVVSAVGLLLYVAGAVMMLLAERANPFAAPAITILKERGHRVIDKGAYRFVRHPMYAGGLCVAAGLPLWLESTAVALLAVVPILIVTQRIRIEERFLRARLDGYTAYTERVRHRLVPGVW